MNTIPDPEEVLLDEEEQYYEDHYEEFVPTGADQRAALMAAAAREPIIVPGKKQMVSIRLDPADVQTIKEQASRLGFAYQTFISALLHQYAQGELINLSEARKLLKR